MPRHYKQNKRKSKKSKGAGGMMMPHDAAQDQNEGMGEQTQLYHMGKKYYGPGYGEASNLPQYPEMSYYPKGYKYLRTGDYPDTVREIDRDEEDNINNLNRQPSDSMY